MSSAKTRILASIREGLGRRAPSEAEDTAGNPPPSSRPRWREPRIERFLGCFERAAGSWARIETADQIPAAAADFLQGQSAVRLRLSGQPALQNLRWPADWEVKVDPQDAEAWPAAIAVAALGVAETGSVVMTSSPECPAAGHFLPDDHLIVLQARHIVDYLEEVWERLQAPGQSMPRAVNLITGPSRTADVEQTMQLGAHGPRRVHLLLLG
ncbi:MAG: lactate utilization protein [Nitrococcus sp.]|nr:lactate utilization protein [Nitrococcus sp.]